MVEIEVQGTRQLRQNGVEGIYVFVVPPSLEELRRHFDALIEWSDDYGRTLDTAVRLTSWPQTRRATSGRPTRRNPT